jgi:hypothetical protein
MWVHHQSVEMPHEKVEVLSPLLQLERGFAGFRWKYIRGSGDSIDNRDTFKNQQYRKLEVLGFEDDIIKIR